MKNKLLLITFFSLIFINLQAQKLEKIKGNKEITTEEYPIDAFEKLILGDTFEVKLIKGNNAHISITTDSNIQNAIEHSVVNNVLRFNYTKRISTRKKPIINVTFTDSLTGIELKDKSELIMLSEINTTKFNLTCSGNSKGTLQITCSDFSSNITDKSRISLDLNSKNAIINSSKSSKIEGEINSTSIEIQQFDKSLIKIIGKTDNLYLSSAGRTDFKGLNFASNNATIVAKDNSNIGIKCISNLELDAKNDSRIYIYDNPKIIIKAFKDNASIYKR